MEFDWSNASKIVIGNVLSRIPGPVGLGLGSMVYIFWPSEKEDVWSSVLSQ
jgi:hypothetical protein